MVLDYPSRAIQVCAALPCFGQRQTTHTMVVP